MLLAVEGMIGGSTLPVVFLNSSRPGFEVGDAVIVGDSIEVGVRELEVLAGILWQHRVEDAAAWMLLEL